MKLYYVEINHANPNADYTTKVYAKSASEALATAYSRIKAILGRYEGMVGKVMVAK